MRPDGGGLRGAILAAGLGRRLEPLTRHLLPKPLFPVGGKIPIAELWVRKLLGAGVEDLCMNVCILKDAVMQHFARAAKLGADIAFVEEDVPSGTLGGVCRQVMGEDAPAPRPGARGAAPASGYRRPTRFRGSTVIVPSGDIVTGITPAELEELHALHRRSGAAFSLVVTPIPPERRKDFGTVVLRSPEQRAGAFCEIGRVERFVEKDPCSPSLLNNASIYLIERELIDALDALRTPVEQDEEPFYDFGKHVFPALLGELPYARLPGQHPVLAIHYTGPWFDIGSKRDYLAVHQALLDGEIALPSAYEQVPFGLLGTRVDADFAKIDIHPPVVIGDGCRIEPGAVIGPYAVIGDGWTVRSGARIASSVLWERYPFYCPDGSALSVEERARYDPHEVGPVRVERSIVAGGRIEADVLEQTVQVLLDGTLETMPIDWVPHGPRR
jgi:NDP-sugar pyrophosphorylase family protein